MWRSFLTRVSATLNSSRGLRAATLADLKTTKDPASDHIRLLPLALQSLIAGTCSGLLVVAFRLSLRRADGLRDSLLLWAHGKHVLGFLVTLAVAGLLTAIAARLVRRLAPDSAGSGIPQVELELKGGGLGDPLRIIVVKFVGGLVSIGTGLALGREGPSVQMGACIASLCGRLFRRSDAERRILLAAGAAAGLATAFNAPVAGAVFVLEEVERRFDLPVTIITLGASVSAISVARLFLGQAPDFYVGPLPYAGFGVIPVYLVLGIFVGFIGAAYNAAILGALAVTDQFHRYPAELVAGLVGVGVGVLGWFAPRLVGGGDPITQRLLDGTGVTLFMLGIAFVVRFVLGAVSYSARTPGGLFSPMLVIGSQSGLMFGNIFAHWFPAAITNHPNQFVIVGMAAIFAAVVRAPITGIILAIELTGSTTLLLPMLAACFTAMLVPTLLRNAPIYDSLEERIVAKSSAQVSESLPRVS
ncbi:MAG: H(+)/Cl(-) exchange transporter ClcA [Candidatus Sulfotelmatobacter sp.]